MKYWGFLLSLFLSMAGHAACPIADSVARTGSLSQALPLYLNCALQSNDDDSQLYLAQVYETGKEAIPRSMQRALLFYHLSAENGNATAMVGLSQLLTALDSSDKTRPEIIEYMDKIQGELSGRTRTLFKGEMLHPYALLVLAAEKPEAKWFYLTTVKSDPNAARLLKAYQIDPVKKQAALKEASLWKQRKMRDVAREVFSVKEYNAFYETLYPDEGMPDSFKRAQAVNKLKERIESRLAP